MEILLAERIAVSVIAAIEWCPLGIVLEEAHGFGILNH
jgi:hypothetical protein